MTYTIQSELDNQLLGARWGCYFMGPINAAEYQIRRKAFETELDQIVGHAFRKRYATMANYKNDVNVRPPHEELPGWDEVANPEWHYLVEQYNSMLASVGRIMRVAIDRDRFEVAVMRLSSGGTHYCIRADKTLLINPDPSLSGRIKKYIPFREIRNG
jgi:hypothetical protein